MEYQPVLKPGNFALKNSGKYIVLKIGSKEWEMKPATLKQFIEIAQYVQDASHPTEFISGYEELKKEQAQSLWPEDDDDLP